MKQTPHRIMHDSLLSIGRSAAWPLFMRNVNTSEDHVNYGMPHIISIRQASGILLKSFKWSSSDQDWDFWCDLYTELSGAGI